MIRRVVIISLGIQCLLFSWTTWAENSVSADTLDTANDQVMDSLSNLKNPFLPPVIPQPAPPVVQVQPAPVPVKKPHKPQPVKKKVEPKPPLDLSSLQLDLKGMVWGIKAPQAIINDQIVGVGDVIEGAKILSITKMGVEILYKGTRIKLTEDKMEVETRPRPKKRRVHNFKGRKP